VVIGQSRTVNVVLEDAPAGLSGYNITVELANGAKAEITAITLPAWAGVYQKSGVPADTAWIKALDLNRQVEAGATGVVLATITTRGDQLGSTAITVTATAMDDDNGSRIATSSTDGTLTVIQAVPQLPGYPAPTDPDGDGFYEDLNGNGRIDFNDVVIFFNAIEWISGQEGFAYFDFNENGRIDFDDLVRLFWGV
jgi:PKD repeat protein